MSNEVKTTASSKVHLIFIAAWVMCTLFYFIQYALRSAPSVMLPEIGADLGLDNTALASIIGLYFYSYAFFALISGVMLDRIGPRFTAPFGMLLVALGCILFGSGTIAGAQLGRFLQGAGSGVAFTSAVYLATRGFDKAWLATAVGVTQCIGMLGGFMGQAVVSPVIHNGWLNWKLFWVLSAAGLIMVFLASLAVTPRTREGKIQIAGLAAPYITVLKNPQSYLCALVAALMFMPTNIGDFVWGVTFMEKGVGVTPDQAAMHVAMVPLGWVIGCPLLGYLSDMIGRRKPVVLASIIVMLLSGSAIVYYPHMLPPYVGGLLLGVSSGAAMVPYTMIKETNPDEVKGTATGVINFIVFVISAVMTNIFGVLIKSISHGQEPDLHVFQTADYVFLIGLAAAFVLTLFIRETGERKAPDVDVYPEENN